MPGLAQTVLALAVAEEAVQFEHRDLHWGNLLIRRVPVSRRARFTLRCAPLTLEQQLSISIIIL